MLVKDVTQYVVGQKMRAYLQNSMPMKKLELPPLVPVIEPPLPDGQLDFPPPLPYMLLEKSHEPDICQAVTVLTRAIKLAPVQRPMLPIDAYGRPFLIVRNPYEDTLLLVEAAVRHFQECGARIELIRLSSFGYLTALSRLQERMPYVRYEHVFDPGHTIMLRGAAWTS